MLNIEQITNAHPVTSPMGSGLELRAQRKDSSVVPLEISVSPVHIL